VHPADRARGELNGPLSARSPRRLLPGTLLRTSHFFGHSSNGLHLGPLQPPLHLTLEGNPHQGKEDREEQNPSQHLGSLKFERCKLDRPGLELASRRQR
jgi:hypothetical protein